MAKKLQTIFNKIHMAEQMRESVSEVANTAYYVFLGDHNDRDSVRDISENENVIIYDTYNNMIQGKRVTPNDIKLGIRNIPYVSNTKYSMFDDTDLQIYTKDYYCIVNASSYYHVYKCLDNANNSYSTVQPNISHISGSNTDFYQTADGYVWKYMYSVTSSIKDKFASELYFPLSSNADVIASAKDGAVNIIKVLNHGKKYDNYSSGSFLSSDIRINGDSKVYQISNSTISTTDGFYTGCLLYISSGVAEGEYRKVVDYISNENGNFLVVNAAFNTTPQNADEWELNPSVEIISAGNQTINAVARAIINSTATNSVHQIEMLEIGEGYNYHIASVVANSVVKSHTSFEESELRVIYSPPGGHGSNNELELLATTCLISVEMANNENGTLLTTNQFNQVGLLKDPLFANVNIRTANSTATYLINEIVTKMDPIRINYDVESVYGNNILVCDNGDFENQLEANQQIYLYEPNDNLHIIATVNSITNSTYLELTQSSIISGNVQLYIPNFSAEGIISSLEAANSVFLKDVNGVFTTGDIVIGKTSGNYGVITEVKMNDQNKNFNTFIQLTRYDIAANTLSGTFEENEIIYETSLSNANATLHSVINNSGDYQIYVSNVAGIIEENDEIVGSSSGATATIDKKLNGQLKYASGSIIYLNNIDPVERSETQKETFKIAFDF